MKKGQIQFVTKSLGIKVALFSYKMIFQIARKIYATRCYFTNRLNRKVVNRPCCMLPENRHQLQAH